jgi:hypothetical protein
MWLVLAGIAFISPVILFYLTNDSSGIVIDKKTDKIIILDKTPPTVIKLDDFIGVELLVNDTKIGVEDIKASKKLIKRTDSICLKIITTDPGNSIQVFFLNEKTKKDTFEYKNAAERAIDVYNKLSEIIYSRYTSLVKNTGKNHSVEFQLKNLGEFRSKLARQSMS